MKSIEALLVLVFVFLSLSSCETVAPTGSADGLLQAIQVRQGRELIDRLREIGLDHYVELPQIAVMGDTSSGKSSLLSALSGVTFPSSDQLTTRCPTQLILSRGLSFKGSVRLHRFQSNHSDHGASIQSMSDVPHAIRRLTKLLVDEGHAISDDAIIIELQDPGLPNLTLTDLPGLVRTVGDSEDKAMIVRIRNMVNRYMKQSRTIIIAIVPANVDMHNTEILQAAQEADPEGTRTIAVVTKLDLVDAGAEDAIQELLLNRKKRMTLGYHAVKCRSQKDLNDGVTIEQGRQLETEFFNNHDYWRRVPQNIWGIDKLTERLVVILQDNIRRSLPSVLDEIDQQIMWTKNEIDLVGVAYESASDRRQVFSDWVGRFLQSMQAAVEGKYDAVAMSALPAQDNTVDLRLRAQIRHSDEIFSEKVQATMKTMPGNDVCEDVKVGDYVVVKVSRDASRYLAHERSYQVTATEDNGAVLTEEFPSHWFTRGDYTPHKLNHLRRYIRQNRGDELSIFPSYNVFRSILQQWVTQWEAPAKALVNEYRQLTLGVASHLADELNAPPAVQHLIKNIATDTLRDLQKDAQVELHAIQVSEERPYTQDPELTKMFAKTLRPELEKLMTGRLGVADGPVQYSEVVDDLLSVNDEQDTMVIDAGLRAYFQTAINRFVDVVPMRLNDLVLQGIVDRMKKELFATTDDKLERMLAESESMRSLRAALVDKLQTLRQAKLFIQEI